MDPATAEAGLTTPVRFFQEIDSTNAEALRALRAGVAGPLWFVAESQIAGRGRRGRSWVSEPGNLFATLLLTDPLPQAKAPQLSLVAAVALHDAVAQAQPALAPRARLKWPNDLLIDGAKAAGILLEAGQGPDRAGIAIGLGVNCAHHPALAGRVTADLGAAGSIVTPAALFAALARAMDRRLADWREGEGFATIREAWLAAAAHRGETVLARIGLSDNAAPNEISGVFEDLDAEGCLILRKDDGTRARITAADIFPLAEAAR